MVGSVNEQVHAHSWVTAEGTLNEQSITSRERLYKGMNGRYVERFTVHTGESYIFKPLTNPGQHGRERWISLHVLSLLPSIYPQLMASSEEEIVPEKSWLIYEDLGPLVHQLQEDTMLSAAVHMAEWHTLWASDWDELPRVGQKPSIGDMLLELRDSQESTDDLLSKLGMALSVSDWDEIKMLIQTAEKELPLVLCHGDLHPGNMADVSGRLVIMDWEHAHLNTPLWDLYHLVDLSHPLFPRLVTPEIRERIIRMYLDESERRGKQFQRVSFKRWYDAYAIVFSLWMLRLIDADLKKADCVWPEEQLRNQWRETAATLEQCMNQLFTE